MIKEVKIDLNKEAEKSNDIFISSIYDEWTCFNKTVKDKKEQWKKLNKKEKKNNYILKREQKACSPITAIYGDSKIGKSNFCIELSKNDQKIVNIDMLKYQCSSEKNISYKILNNLYFKKYKIIYIFFVFFTSILLVPFYIIKFFTFTFTPLYLMVSFVEKLYFKLWNSFVNGFKLANLSYQFKHILILDNYDQIKNWENNLCDIISNFSSLRNWIIIIVIDIKEKEKINKFLTFNTKYYLENN